MSNPAETHVVPDDRTVFRTVFLYVGQGESTLLLAPDGDGGIKYILVDMNRDTSYGGLDVVDLLQDVLPQGDDDKPVLDVFVNTHPHADHIGGLKKLRENIAVRSVWHTGFDPGEDHKGQYDELKSLIKAADEELIYDGTRSEEQVGEVTYNILSPAEHVKEKIDNESGDKRYARIHEYCGVIRFGYGKSPAYILITGDSDKAAWKNHITDYHEERLPADVLSASHHGSRTFFKSGKDDADPYEGHLSIIAPDHLIISSPTQEESPHDHPHDDALTLYKKVVDEENILVLGNERECIIVDIDSDGEVTVRSDDGALAEHYAASDGSNSESDGSKGNTRKSRGAPAYIRSKIDPGREMG